MPMKRSPISRAPIVAERVRRINGQGFCFVPHRFLRNGFFATLSPNELLLYFFLILAGDRQGISFYHYDRICSLLQIPVERYLRARNGLIEKDLVAFDGSRFRILSLPERPVLAVSKPLKTPAGFEEDDEATIHEIIKCSLAIEE